MTYDISFASVLMTIHAAEDACGGGTQYATGTTVAVTNLWPCKGLQRMC